MNPIYFQSWCFVRLLYQLLGGGVFNAERVPMTGPVILAFESHASIWIHPSAALGVLRGDQLILPVRLVPLPRGGSGYAELEVRPRGPRGRRRGGTASNLDRPLLAGARHSVPGRHAHKKTASCSQHEQGMGLTVIKSNAPLVPVRVLELDASVAHSLSSPHRLAVKDGSTPGRAIRAEAKVCLQASPKAAYQQIDRRDHGGHRQSWSPYRTSDFP